jgi:ubiquinone/menaquinone biosynthesis C-methylase UbiE
MKAQTSEQKEVFLQGEGNAWYQRNRSHIDALSQTATDPVVNCLQKMDLAAPKILEIGAANGWRLHILRQLYPQATLCGIEPSAQAIADAPSGIDDIKQGTAEILPWKDNSFDLLIYGFCLYLCDRKDLFRIAAEADRVLCDGGKIIIYDFYPTTPYHNNYTHYEGLNSYKMDYSRLFLGNPAYSLEELKSMPHPGSSGKDPDNTVAIIVLKKNELAAWPSNPYKS